MESCVQKTACFWLAKAMCRNISCMFPGFLKYMAVTLLNPKLSIHLTIHQS